MRAEIEPPEHIPYSTWGERIDEIRVSSPYMELGRLGVEARGHRPSLRGPPYGTRLASSGPA